MSRGTERVVTSEQSPQWLRRLDWLATLTPDELGHLREHCEASGHHVTSGEFLPTDPPTHRCYHCGTSFHA